MPISQKFPDLLPILLLDFANSGTLDPRITFSRSSTATFYGSNKLIQTAAAGAARFDHDPVTGDKLGLLIEEQRTNLLTYSEDFSNAVWTKDSATITTNQIIAPDGTLTADLLVASTRLYWFDNTGIIGAKVQSIFAKQQTGTSIAISAVGGQTVVGGANVTVNLTTGAVTSGHVAPNVVVSLVGNGFWRIAILTSVSVASGNSTYWQILSTPGIYIWGAQLEAGAFATSYIPTVASQVTRLADAASISGTDFTSWFNQNEGTIIGEAKSVQGLNSYIAGIWGGNASNRTALNWDSSNRFFAGTRYLGTFSGSSTTAGTAPQNTYGSIAFAYQVGNNGGSWNGETVIASSPAGLPTFSRLDIGNNNQAAGNWLNGHVKRIAYYPRRLINTQLQALSS